MHTRKAARSGIAKFDMLQRLHRAHATTASCIDKLFALAAVATSTTCGDADSCPSDRMQTDMILLHQMMDRACRTGVQQLQ